MDDTPESLQGSIDTMIKYLVLLMILLESNRNFMLIRMNETLSLLDWMNHYIKLDLFINPLWWLAIVE